MKALEIINEKIKYCQTKGLLVTDISFNELEVIKVALEKSNAKNTAIRAVDVWSTWDEDNDYLIGTCPICKNVDKVTSSWYSDIERRCSSCGQKLLFSLEKKRDLKNE